MAEGEKLQKVLAARGAGSRREIERAIAAGRVMVNGEAANIGRRVFPKDDIRLDGRAFAPPRGANPAARARLLLYHKPPGLIVSRRDPQGRPSVFESLPPCEGRWINIGRLDFSSEGLLLFSNNGDLADYLAHSRHGRVREYRVRASGALPVDDDGAAAKKTAARGGQICPSLKAQLDGGGGGRNRWHRVQIAEGRNRVVRRHFAAFGLEVSRLIRVRHGEFMLPPNLRAGEFAEVESKTARRLLRAAQKDAANRKAQAGQASDLN